MRKSTKLMAGLGVVAGIGVALAPLATFAVGNMGTDSLTVNVASDCTVVEESGSAVVLNGTYAGDGVPGETVDLTGPGTGKVAAVSFDCSENSKVSIAATTTGLAYGSADTIAADHIKANYTGTNGITITPSYTGANYGALASGDGVVVATGTAGASADMTFTVNSYQAVLKDNQKPGTYTGTVDYNFTLVNE